MASFRTLLTILLLVLMSGVFTTQEVRRKIPPPEFDRETVVDENGLQQWAPFDHECPHCHGRGIAPCVMCTQGPDNPNCLACGGKKECRCLACNGTKKVLDPILTMRCAYCDGTGFYRCGLCAGAGKIGPPDQPISCGACKKKGLYVCTACEGKGVVPTIRIKRKLPWEAKLKDMQDLRKLLQETIETMQKFEPQERASKSMKAIEASVKKVQKKLPPLKGMLELLETVQKGLTKAGAAYQGHEERLAYQFLTFNDRSVYFLQYQVRVLDLCIARAEFNESVNGK